LGILVLPTHLSLAVILGQRPKVLRENCRLPFTPPLVADFDPSVTSLFVLLCLLECKVRFGMQHDHTMRWYDGCI
jgi:hypothetical protein